MGHILIPLTQEKWAIIDIEDWDKVSRHTWCAFKGKATTYAATNIRREGERRGYRCVRLHQLIMDAQSGQFIDHINGDGLDNRKCNLRFCSKSQNSANRGKKPSCASRFIGVTHNRATGKWAASVVINRHRKGLGHYATEEEAAKVRDRAVKKLFGEFARLNFSGD